MQLGGQLVAQFQRLVFLADFIIVFQDRRNAAAVFLLQLIYGVQPALDGIQLPRVKVGVLQGIPGTGAQLLQHIIGVVQLITVFLEFGQEFGCGVQIGGNFLQDLQSTPALLTVTVQEGINRPQ